MKKQKKVFSKKQIREEAIARIQEAAFDQNGGGEERIAYIQGVLDLLNSFPDEPDEEEGEQDA